MLKAASKGYDSSQYNGKSPKVSLAEGIANGLAPDGGLYMPDELPRLPKALFMNIREMKLKDIAFVVCDTLFGDVLSSPVIKKIVDEALNFDIPLRHIGNNKYVLELLPWPYPFVQGYRGQVYGTFASGTRSRQ